MGDGQTNTRTDTLVAVLRSHTDGRAIMCTGLYTILVPQWQLHRLGDRTLAAAGPRLWNSLTTHISQPVLTSFPEIKDVFIARGTSAW